MALADGIMKFRTPFLLLAVLLAGCNAGGPGLLGADADSSTGVSDATSPAPVESACLTPQNSLDLTDQVLRLINIERFDIGAVVPETKLTSIAAQYACTMVDERFFGHTEPKTDQDVTQRVEQGGYSYAVVGENLAAGYWNPQEIVEAWLGSDAHREIMLDPAFTQAGVAVRYGGEYGVYCVLIMARPVE